jgi:protein-disulfide isomerase
MLSLDELERLSRFAAGDLSEGERRQIEVELRAKPDVARALEQFRLLDEAFFELESELGSESDDRLIHRVVRQRGRGVWLMAAIATVAILAGTAMVLRYGRSAARMPHGIDSAAAPSSTQILATRTTGASGPLILKTAQGNILLLSGARSQVDKAGALTLETGGLVVDGRAVVFANGLRFAIDGLAAVTTEPGDVFAHVMQRLQSMPEGKDIQMRLSRWSGPPPVIGAASVALLVASGTAQAQAPDGAPVHVKAGQSWFQAAREKTLVARQDATQSTSRGASDPSAEFVRKMNALSEALQPSVGALTRCYKEGLAQNPNLEGSILADLTLGIGPDGKGQVTAATIAKDYTLASPFVASCVLQELSRASVPAPAGATEVITVPIYFHRGESGGDPWVEIPRTSSSAPTTSPPQAAQTVEVGNAPSRGPSNASVTVVEFTDPECPYCGRAHESINALYKELGDRVRFVLKFSPMPFHRRAPGAAAAAFAAGEQGQFWEYVDALYAHPDALDRAGLERMAAQLGLDRKEFTDALDSQRFASAIEADLAQAKSLGIKGVPTFYINGRPLVGARSIDDMRAMIVEALNERR